MKKLKPSELTDGFCFWGVLHSYYLTETKSHPYPGNMILISHLLTALVALIHVYILWLEMFAWTTRGKKVFKSFPGHLFEPTKALAANQGLYNGFLAAGLIWSFLIADPAWQTNVRLFFLGCVAVAGIYGAASADKKILYVQTIPATAAIAALLLS